MVLRHPRLAKSSCINTDLSVKILSNVMLNYISYNSLILPLVWDTWLIIRLGVTAVSYSSCIILCFSHNNNNNNVTCIAFIPSLRHRYLSVSMVSVYTHTNLVAFTSDCWRLEAKDADFCPLLYYAVCLWYTFSDLMFSVLYVTSPLSFWQSTHVKDWNQILCGNPYLT